jgi:hypothetical protein
MSLIYFLSLILKGKITKYKLIITKEINNLIGFLIKNVYEL